MDKRSIIKKFKAIKLLILDIDGVLTDGGVYFDDSGQTMRRFHVHDGLGIKSLMSSGVNCAIITAHTSKSVENRAAQLGISELYQGVKDKATVLNEIINKINITTESVAYVGDDLNDLPTLKQVGFPITVANSVPEVKQAALYVTKKDGGCGAVREVCDLILQSIKGKQKAVGVIPARYDSTRFPGKPLALINNHPLVYHVYKKAIEAGLDKVVIATDDQRILNACQELECKVVLTSGDHRSGTDRVAAVAKNDDADIFINIQGDEPLIEPVLIDELVHVLSEEPTLDIATFKKAIRAEEEIESPHIVKVVVDKNGYAQYFSRSAIPYLADGKDEHRKKQYITFYKHIGIYGYRKSSLLRMAELPASPLELAESLEQLRALEHGMRIKVIETDYESIGVDTPEDLERVRAFIK